MVRGFFALIIGLMLPFAAMAQNYSVSGTVKEKATGKAVDFATIALLLTLSLRHPNQRFSQSSVSMR